jgi:16S rRNA (guanine966-N2)-methyltransferase
MRVIAGKYKNKMIESPTGLTTRPALSRVRKSIMDILQPHLEGARVLDLFSGTGVFSIESLSRGATFVLSIDADKKACAAIKKNKETICPKDPFRLIQGDVLKSLPTLRHQEEPFDVIAVTPPYSEGLEDKTLALIESNIALIHDETVIFVQHFHKDDIQLEWTDLEHVRTKKYGKTKVEFFMKRLDEARNDEEE